MFASTVQKTSDYRRPDYQRFQLSALTFDRPKNFIFVGVKKSNIWLTARPIIGADFQLPVPHR